MDNIDDERLKLLLKMARHFGSRWSQTSARPDVVSIERKCWLQIYELMNLSDDIDREIEEQDDSFIPYKDLIQTPVNFPYLERQSDCQNELWRLLSFYHKMKDTASEENRQVRNSRRMILRLLLQKKWECEDLKLARCLIESAILCHSYFPVISLHDATKRQNLDSPPF